MIASAKMVQGNAGRIYPKKQRDMRPIAIVPRLGHEIGIELYDSITCLRSAGIHARNAIIGQAFALLWVDDENISISVETLRNAGFQAAALTETDVPH
jgi:hypothetical protein